MKANYLVHALVILLAGCSAEPRQSEEKSTNPLLTAPAELISLDSVSITPPSIRRMWQYKIQHLAKENSRVKTGDILVKLDAQDVRNRLIERQSELDAEVKNSESKALTNIATKQDLILAIAQAKMDYEKESRKAAIIDASLSKIEKSKQQKDFEIAELKLAQAKQKLQQHQESAEVNQILAKSKIKSLQLKVDDIKQSIKKLTIVAPKPGIVMYSTDWNGEKPAVGETVFQGRALVTIPSLDNMAIKAEFDEADTARLYKGQKVKVILEAYPEQSFSGKVKTLGQAYKPKSRQNKKIVFDVIVELDQLDSQIMRPGMKAKVEVMQEAV